MGIEPNGIDAEPLRRLDLPFQIVADHSVVACGDTERVHGVQIGALFRLASPPIVYYGIVALIEQIAGSVSVSDN